AARAGSAARASGSRRSSPAADLPEEAVPAFERLRAWRAAVAKERGIPAYVVFHDATLRQIAADSPSSLAELAR
ncbi:HRDC domain-containing protein, partial [Planomonospora algeriensis]